MPLLTNSFDAFLQKVGQNAAGLQTCLSPMVHVKSPYPAVPTLPPINFYDALFGRPPTNAIPKEHVVHIDALTGQQRTFGEFLERARDGATALAAPVNSGGFALDKSKDIVGVLSFNCLDYITLVHSCLSAAIPFTAFPFGATPSELSYLWIKTGATRLFVHPSLLNRAIEVANSLGFPTNKIHILEGHAPGRMSFGDGVDNVRQNKLPRLPVQPVQRNTLAYLMFSSGTSGPPKAVMISHDNLFFTNVQTISGVVEALKVAPPPPSIKARWLAVLPMYHSFGLHFSMFRSFLSAVTIVILPHWNLDRFLSAVPKYKITHLALVPSFVHQIVSSPKSAKVDFSSVKFLGSAGSYLPKEVADKATVIVSGKGDRVDVQQGYGLSECTLSAMGKPVPGQFGLQPIPSSTGILLAGMEARVVREDGSEAAYNEPGELWLKGPNIALGYWKDEQATASTFVDGWLKTGDQFKVDKTGTFYYQDRVKDTLKISGAQVAPAEIEDTLLAQPDKLISDVAVAGVPGGRDADEKVPRAWIVLSPAGKKVSPEEVKTRLIKWTEIRLSRFKWLKGGIAIIDGIPKTPTGKPLRRVLQDEHAKWLRESRAKL